MSSASSSGFFRTTRNDASLTTHDAATAPPLSIASTTAGKSALKSGAKSAYGVQPAGPGDHPLVYQLLRTVFHAPSDSEFHAQLDHPHYEPPQRLLVRHNGPPIAHVRTSPRETKWGSLRVPTAQLADLATLPEFRRRGCATALLSAAEQFVQRQGAEFASLRTSCPEFYARRGWVVGGRHVYSSAPPRNLLSVLSSATPERRLPSFDPSGESTEPTVRVRLWRHIEQDNLMQLYDAATADSFGPLVRNDAYWHWLLCRRGYDRIYVAVDSTPGSSEKGETETIVGYAVMKRGRIVELIADQQRGDVKSALLARACGDAIERDEHLVRYEAPPGDALHPLFVQAGGMHRWREVDAEQVCMVKLFDPARWLTRCGELLHERARTANLPRPFELGIEVAAERFVLVGTRRSVRLERGRLGRSYLRCDPAFFTQLLLGHHDAAVGLASEQLTASTRVAGDIAAALFPRLPVWLPPLDDLPA